MKNETHMAIASVSHDYHNVASPASISPRRPTHISIQSTLKSQDPRDTPFGRQATKMASPIRTSIRTELRLLFPVLEFCADRTKPYRPQERSSIL
jgi:hypothetical protein